MSLAFRFLTAGESHGEALVAVIDGVPAGLPSPLEGRPMKWYETRDREGRQ